MKQHHDLLDNIISRPKIEHEDVSSKHMEKIFDLIYSDDKIELKTDLNRQQVLAITKLEIYGTLFGVDLTNQIAQAYMRLAVSDKRGGRKEFTEISKAGMQPQDVIEPTLNERLFGKR